MKNILMYNYKELYNPIIYKKDGIYYIKNENITYKLIKIINYNELEEIYQLLKNNNLHNQYDEIIKTNDNKLCISYKNEVYTLLKEKRNIRTIRYQNIQITNKTSIDRSNWKNLWIIKNENIRKLLETNDEYKIINESFEYYYGLAENAIQYLEEDELVKTITSKRIKDNMDNSPINIVIDTIERDIAEKIKYLFFYKNEKIDSIINNIRKIEIKKLNINRLYARLLYPTYYYDYLEKIINKELPENSIKSIINKNIEYEILLKEIYKLINKEKKPKKIDWL